jgi:type I restriction enzyme S subunit
MAREMKDSGVEWIGDIPNGWNITRNKFVMVKEKQICPIYKNQDVLSLTQKGVIVRDLDNPTGKMPTSFDGYQYIHKGNLLMCLFDIDVTPRCIGLIKDDGITSPAYSQFIVNHGFANYYYYYYLMLDFSKELLHLAKNLRYSLTEELLGFVPVPFPPLEEQKNISNFLDKKCSVIDSLTADIEKQISLLEDYKKSIITEAVTKGLAPNVEMKDSGIEWIGAIPSQWKVEKIKFHLYRNDIKNPGDMEVLSLYREYGVVPKDSRDDNYNVTSLDVTKYKYVKPGNLVINKMKAWQGSLAVSEYEGIVSPAYYVYYFSDSSLVKKYFHYLVRACYKDEFRRLSGGIREGQWDLPSEAFDNTLMIIPSMKEQKEIVSYLDKKCSEIDSLISEKKKQLEKLSSYKQSMIYEYVTGKKEVPTQEIA